MLPLIGLGLAAGGAAANYMGGRAEAKRKKGATKDYERESAALYDAMAKDAWNQGQERQRSTGKQIEGLTPSMSTPATEAPQASSFISTEPSGRGEAYDNILQSAMKPQAEVDQANLNATQSGMDRAQLGRILDALGYSSSIEGQVNDPGHKRLQWQKQQELEAARQRLESILSTTGNKARNLQLLGSILNTAGSATMMAGAFGGPSPGVPGGVGATAGAPLAAGASGPIGIQAGTPTSIYAYMR